jgi:hypothetical protein
MSYCYIPVTITIWKGDVCLFEADCEAKCEYSLPDGPGGPVDWDVTAFHFADKRADGSHVYAEIHRTEPLFGVLYADIDREWIDTQLREALAQDGICNLYMDPDL